MQQHFDLQDVGTRLGTTLVSDMHKVGIKACIIMHTGNKLSTNVAIYKQAGMHGIVGKSKNLKEMIAMIYRCFLDCQQEALAQISNTPETYCLGDSGVCIIILCNWLWEHCHVAHIAVGGMWLQHLPENGEQAVIGPALKQGRSLHIGRIWLNIAPSVLKT